MNYRDISFNDGRNDIKTFPRSASLPFHQRVTGRPMPLESCPTCGYAISTIGKDVVMSSWATRIVFGLSHFDPTL